MSSDRQWWLAELDQYGNPKLCDGAHSQRQGAEHALYLINRLGLSRGRRFAVAEVILTEAKEDPRGANEEALATLNSIGLRPLGRE